jgi:hypothetical protein
MWRNHHTTLTSTPQGEFGKENKKQDWAESELFKFVEALETGQLKPGVNNLADYEKSVSGSS